MSLTLRWVGENELDRVIDCRTRCYGSSEKSRETFERWLHEDLRGKHGDFCLAERDGQAVGTTTSLAMQMHVRGKLVPCQGVAYVGTIKTMRRGGAGNERGIASQLMHESLRIARERGDVVSALIPFRGSFYEHFGYGFVERRMEWTLPLSVLPAGNFDGFRFAEASDLPGIMACHQTAMRAGQCQINRPDSVWPTYQAVWQDGFVVLDSAADGSVQSWMYLTEAPELGRSALRIPDFAYTSLDALRRQLHFLHSLRDQHSLVYFPLPRDVPLNWMLRETQLPHRPVEHAIARAQPITRLQLRVLDHAKFLDGQRLETDISGSAIVAIRESEGSVATIRVEIDAGHASAASSQATAQVVVSDKIWAAIACGEVAASDFARLRLVESNDREALRTLDALTSGPVPFCTERF